MLDFLLIMLGIAGIAASLFIKMLYASYYRRARGAKLLASRQPPAGGPESPRQRD